MNRNKQLIKANLFNKLVKECAFWSYDPKSVTLENTTDEMLIYKVLVHLDIDEINQLFLIFDKTKIKSVWEEQLCIQEPYYHGLNAMIGGIYFKIKNPNKYIQKIQKKHFEQLEKQGEEMFKGIVFND